MELFSHDELKSSQGFNFAPMIDFLFLMLALFATLSISRASLFDADLQLVQVKAAPNSAKPKDQAQVNLSVSSTGRYKWLTEFQSYPMETALEIQKELKHQMEVGALPKDPALTEVLLHIDKSAPWEPIAQIIFAAKELGMTAHPVYEPLE